MLLALAGCEPGPAQYYPEPPHGSPGREGEAEPWGRVSGLEIVWPAEGTRLTDRYVTVRGTAAFEGQLDRITVRVGDADEVVAEGRKAWQATVALAVGHNDLVATAEDPRGGDAEARVSLVRVHRLVLQPAAPRDSGGLRLRLDRPLLEALVTPEEAARIELIALDPVPLLREALLRLSRASPGDPVVAGQHAARLQALLAMTPDTATLEGTSLAGVVDLAETLGLPPPKLLAALLGVGVEDPLLPLEPVVDALADDLIGSHPAVSADPDSGAPRLTVTLHDVLADFAPLATRFGPAGGHPGVLAGPMRVRMLAPDFSLEVAARGAVERVAGLDLSGGVAPLLLRRDPGAGVIELDLDTPGGLRIEGLDPDPRVDLSIRLTESPERAAAGTTQRAGEDGDFFRGDGDAWALAPWTLEHVVVDAAYRALRGRYSDHGYQRRLEFSVGSMEGVAAIDWDRGWVRVETLMGMGEPPPAQYVWDLVGEVAQARLHDGALAEGDLAPHLELTDVPLGLTSEQVLDGVRGSLAGQQAALAEAFVGGWEGYASPCDLFVLGAPDGEDMLAFVAASDVPGKDYAYPQPGLFSDAELTAKLSEPYGPLGREALPIPSEGALTVFVRDEGGRSYRLEVQRVSDGVALVWEPADEEGT